jgi:hypothetical protein
VKPGVLTVPFDDATFWIVRDIEAYDQTMLDKIYELFKDIKHALDNQRSSNIHLLEAAMIYYDWIWLVINTDDVLLNESELQRKQVFKTKFEKRLRHMKKNEAWVENVLRDANYDAF